ncbi:hypothetical protein MTO96_045789 [Rhipicephalus appendiculatus]
MGIQGGKSLSLRVGHVDRVLCSTISGTTIMVTLPPRPTTVKLGPVELMYSRFRYKSSMIMLALSTAKMPTVAAFTAVLSFPVSLEVACCAHWHVEALLGLLLYDLSVCLRHAKESGVRLEKMLISATQWHSVRG